MEACGPFTRQLWKSIEKQMEALLACDFVCQLAAGTLSPKAFHHYLSQDALYLQDDNKALMNLSERASSAEEQSFFRQLAEDGIAIEESLQGEYFQHFGIAKAKQKFPAVDQYTQHLLHHTTASDYAVGVAACLPCFWVYNSIGSEIYQKAVSPNAYHKWIDTYQGAEYESYTLQFIQLTEDIGSKASPELQKQMTEAFGLSSNFELLFFREALSMG